MNALRYSKTRVTTVDREPKTRPVLTFFSADNFLKKIRIGNET